MATTLPSFTAMSVGKSDGATKPPFLTISGAILGRKWFWIKSAFINRDDRPLSFLKNTTGISKHVDWFRISSSCGIFGQNSSSVYIIEADTH